jgi:hypothetical protein
VLTTAISVLIIRCCEGNKHHNWQGGISKDTYYFIFTNEEFKQIVRDRDGNICLNCNKTEKQNGEKLVVHHINYDKKDCDLKNLVCVCRSCNAKANTYRDWHTKWYQLILNKRYKYEY